MKKLGIVDLGPKRYVIFYVKKVFKYGEDKIYLFNKEDVFYSSPSIQSRELAFLREAPEWAGIKNFEFGVLGCDSILSDEPHEFIKMIFGDL